MGECQISNNSVIKLFCENGHSAISLINVLITVCFLIDSSAVSVLRVVAGQNDRTSYTNAQISNVASYKMVTRKSVFLNSRLQTTQRIIEFVLVLFCYQYFEIRTTKVSSFWQYYELNRFVNFYKTSNTKILVVSFIRRHDKRDTRLYRHETVIDSRLVQSRLYIDTKTQCYI